MKRKPQVVNSKKEHAEAMKRLEELAGLGDGNLSPEQAREFTKLAQAVEAFEANDYIADEPETLSDYLELEMYRHRMKQKDMAKKLGVGPAKFSQILSSKRQPDVEFLLATHRELGIDGNTLMHYVEKAITQSSLVQKGTSAGVLRNSRSAKSITEKKIGTGVWRAKADKVKVSTARNSAPAKKKK